MKLLNKYSKKTKAIMVLLLIGIIFLQASLPSAIIGANENKNNDEILEEIDKEPSDNNQGDIDDDTEDIEDIEEETDIDPDQDIDEGLEDDIEDIVDDNDTEKEDLSNQKSTSYNKPMGLPGKPQMVPMSADGEDDNGPRDLTDNTDDIKSYIKISYREKDEDEFKELETNKEFDDGIDNIEFKAKFVFELEDHEIDDVHHRIMKEGDYFYFPLPDVMEDLILPSEGLIIQKMGSTEIIATAGLVTHEGKSKIKVIFTDFVEDKEEFEIEGNFEFGFNLNLSSIKDGEKGIITIPIGDGNEIKIGVTKPEEPSKIPSGFIKTESSYNHETRELIWNIRIKPDIGDFSGYKIKDIINLKYLDFEGIEHGDLNIEEGENYSFDYDSGELTYTIPDGAEGIDYRDIKIKTKVKGSVYASADPIIIKNKAYLEGNPEGEKVELTSNEAEKKITPDWLKKKGTPFEGNKIKWTIDVNTTRQEIYDVIVTDKFSSDVELDMDSVMVDGAEITVKYAPYTPDENDNNDYAVLEKSNGTSELKIYIQRGIDNISNAKRTITLVTKIKDDKTAMENPDATYNNEASIKGKFPDGNGEGEGIIPEIGTGIIGVNVPAVSIVKGHEALTDEDKSNGTITWTIRAASNYAQYGKTEIIDTLPNDQKYEKVLWKDGDTYKEIYPNPDTSLSSEAPIAVIDEIDEQKLTITFNEPKYLQTQQFFKVKTKIDPEIYGQNLTNETFTNKAEAIIHYEEDGEPQTSKATDSDKVDITNTLISKTSIPYSGNTTGEGENPRIDYSITINDNRMPLTNVEVTDDLNNIKTLFTTQQGSSTEYDNNTIEWTYVNNTFKIERLSGNEDENVINLENITPSYEDGVITVKFGESVTIHDKYKITFTIETDVNAEGVKGIFSQNGTMKLKGNEAAIKADLINDGEVSTPGTTGSQEIENTVLGKHGEFESLDDQIVWTFNINQHRFELDSTKIVDILPSGLTLDPTSIKLYRNVLDKNGNFVKRKDLCTEGCNAVDVTETGFGDDNSKILTYTNELIETGENAGRYKLAFDLPCNKTDFILEFATYINPNLVGSSITNEATYSGEEGYIGENSSHEFRILSSAGGSSTTKKSITVHKKDNETEGAISDAVFELHWLPHGYPGTIENPIEPVFLRSLISDNDGKAVFRGLAPDEKYTITEVEVPDGYLLDDKEPREFTAGQEDSMTFENTPIKKGSWEPNVKKILEGKNIIHEFEFEVYDVTDDEPILIGKTSDQGTQKEEIVNWEWKDNNIEDEKYEDIFNFTHPATEEDLNGFEFDANNEFEVTEKKFKIIEKKLDGLTYAEDENGVGYTLDTTEHEITVEVINEKGRENLKIIVKDEDKNNISDEDGNISNINALTFTNKYNTNSITTTSFDVTKSLTGYQLREDAFTFELYELDSSGKIKTDQPLQIQNNIDVDTPNETGEYIDNTISFEGIEISLDNFEDNPFGLDREDDVQSTRTKTYQLVEKNPEENNSNYIYDENIYTIIIEVTDNDEGVLTAGTPIIKKNGKEYTEDTIIFNNSYDVKWKPTATKRLDTIGKTLQENKFTFNLIEVDEYLNEIEDGHVDKAHNKKTGNIEFNEISYKQIDLGGEDSMNFYYIISEEDDNEGRDPTPEYGYNYDNTRYLVTVTVTDNKEGTLTVEEKINILEGNLPIDEPISEIEFENTYKTNNVTLNLGIGEKILSGRPLEDKQFTFVLKDTNKDEIIKGDITHDADGNIDLSGLFEYSLQDMDMDMVEATLNEDGTATRTFNYTLSEVHGDKEYYTYSNKVYNIEVTLTDNDEGELSLSYAVDEEDQGSEEIKFENSYEANGSLTIHGKKTLDFRDISNEEFIFILKGDTELDGIESDKDGKFSFTLTYNQENIDEEFTYILSESGDKSWFEYDENRYEIKVKVKDQGDGTLKPEVTSITYQDKDGVSILNDDGDEILITNFDENNTEIVFENIYRAYGTINIEATKEIKDKPTIPDDFTFVLKSTNSEGGLSDEKFKIVDEENVLDYKSEIEVTNSGPSIKFGSIYYDEQDLEDGEATFYYLIEEVDSKKSFYEYDTSKYLIEVKVKDEGEGKLNTSIEKVYKLAEEEGAFTEVSDKEIKFSNQYKAKESLELQAFKTLDGRKLDDNQFSFSLTRNDGKTYESVSNDENGIIKLPKLEYNQEDIDEKYTYSFKEDISTEMKGYTYDDTVYTITVNLTDDNDNGTLTPNYTITKPDVDGNDIPVGEKEMVFKNTYTTDSITLDLTARKELLGRKLENEQFKFILNRVDSEGNIIEEIKSDITNEEDGTITLPELTYTQGDMEGKEEQTFYYTFEEENGGVIKNGYTYDNSVYTIEVVVKDDGEGELNAELSSITKPNDKGEMIGVKYNPIDQSKNEFKFINIYKAKGGTQIIAQKRLDGKAIPDGEFTFIIKEVDEDGEETDKYSDTAQNDQDGNITFDLEYDQNDIDKETGKAEFFYQISEVNKGIGGYTYDPSVYTIQINVSDENENGKLDVDWNIKKPENANGIIFTNSYETSGSELSLKGTKYLEGRNLEDKEFTFVLNQVIDGKVDEIQRVKNREDGSIVFEDIEYIQGDMGNTYYYTISELDEEKPGYLYDNSLYSIEVQVIDNNDGTLKTKYTITKSGGEDDTSTVKNIEFLNTYRADDNLSIKGKKILEGRDLKDEMFTFTLEDGESGEILQTITNDGEGDIIFDEIAFDQDSLGSHSYLIKEVPEDEDGFTYDNTIYNLSANVIDNGDGTLDIETILTKNKDGKVTDAEEIEFVNLYEDFIEEDTKGSGTIKTGEDLQILLFGLIGLLSIGLIILVIRKRAKN